MVGPLQALPVGLCRPGILLDGWAMAGPSQALPVGLCWPGLLACRGLCIAHRLLQVQLPLPADPCPWRGLGS